MIVSENKVGAMDNFQERGFALIKLMIVIANLGIILAIAIPAFQYYSVCAKASEEIFAAAPLKKRVTGSIVWGEAPLPAVIDTSGLGTEHIASILIATDGSDQIAIATPNTGAAKKPLQNMEASLSSREIRLLIVAAAEPNQKGSADIYVQDNGGSWLYRRRIDCEPVG